MEMEKAQATLDVRSRVKCLTDAVFGSYSVPRLETQLGTAFLLLASWVFEQSPNTSFVSGVFVKWLHRMLHSDKAVKIVRQSIKEKKFRFSSNKALVNRL